MGLVVNDEMKDPVDLDIILDNHPEGGYKVKVFEKEVKDKRPEEKYKKINMFSVFICVAG